jgi:hypothetical protein
MSTHRHEETRSKPVTVGRKEERLTELLITACKIQETDISV